MYVCHTNLSLCGDGWFGGELDLCGVQYGVLLEDAVLGHVMAKRLRYETLVHMTLKFRTHPQTGHFYSVPIASLVLIHNGPQR